VLFDVRTTSHGGWGVVRVNGEVDLATLPALSQALDRCREGSVALELGSVDLWEPVAFGVVVAAALRARRRGGRFAVVCPAGRVRDVFAESGVDRIVPVVAGLDALDRVDDLAAEGDGGSGQPV
jgi:stage II sporulation protein AA (anti-sigma F factor antagonist)